MSSSVGYLELLRRRPAFRRVWLGALVSLLGDWFSLIALYGMLDAYTGRGEAVGLILLLRVIPSALFGPLAGVLADRLPRRAILVACDLVRAALVLGFLLVESKEQVWLIYALTFAQATFTAFFEPAEQAAIAATVDQSELVAANTLHGVTWSAMLSVGAVAGGLVAGLLGARASFVIDACSYLASAAFIARAAIPRLDRTGAPTLSVTAALGEFGAALRRVTGSRALLRALSVKSGWALSGGGALVLYTIFGQRVVRGQTRPEFAIGVLLAMRGVGALLGPLVARRVGGDSPAFLQRAIAVSFGFLIVFWLLFSLAPTLPLAAVALTFAHLGSAVQWVFSNSLIALSTEDALRGRVFSLDTMATTLVMGASCWATGIALDASGLSPRTLMAVLALLQLVPLGLWLSLREPRAGA